jgi:hypothetical protein
MVALSLFLASSRDGSVPAGEPSKVGYLRMRRPEAEGDTREVTWAYEAFANQIALAVE